MVCNQHLRCPHSSNPSYGSSECWYHQLWGDEAPCLELPVHIWDTNQHGDYLNTIPADLTSTNLIFLRNTFSSYSFLVDTGASAFDFPHPTLFSVVPWSISSAQNCWLFLHGFLWNPTYSSPVWFSMVWLNFLLVDAYPGLWFPPTCPPPGWCSWVLHT